MKKKLLSLALAVVLCISIIPSALADGSFSYTYVQDVPGGTVTYSTEVRFDGSRGTKWTVTGYTGNVTEILFLDKIECEIPDFGRYSNSVSFINDKAFANCASLTSISIPNGITAIGGKAFYGCINLSSVSIPSSVTSVGTDAFSDTPWLTEWLPSQEFAVLGGTLMTYNGSGGDVTIPTSVTWIGKEAFKGCKSLTSVTIPNGVTAIRDYAFSGCSGLTSVSIPSSVTDIGGRAFQGCSNLSSVIIPSGVTSIEYNTFSGCTSLTSVVIPSSVTKIKGSAFEKCSSLTSVNIPASVTSIGEEAFCECKGLTNVIIPSSVTSIGFRAFYDCTELTSVSIPSSVTKMDYQVFNRCTSLTDIYYGGSETQWSAFDFNKHTIPEGVTVHYNSPMPDTPSDSPAPSNTAYASTQNVGVDGKTVEFQAYALKDENGYSTNYIKLRDVAQVLNGTDAKFNVGWDGATSTITVTSGESYQSNGSEMNTPFSGNRDYQVSTSKLMVNGKLVDVQAVLLKDDNGAGYTYFKLRDLGKALNFNVSWIDGKIVINTDQPYSDAN